MLRLPVIARGFSPEAIQGQHPSALLFLDRHGGECRLAMTGQKKQLLRVILVGLIAALCAPAAVPQARATDEPVFEIEMKDGVITPSRLEVPAKTRFKIIVRNTGKAPAEFESTELRKEVVVPAGGAATMIIRTLDAGEYKFFDDFRVDAPPAVVVAK